MQSGNALFYSVADRALYDMLTAELHAQVPRRRIACLGDPIERGKVILSMADALELLPSSRLFFGWAFLNDDTEKNVGPALKKNHIVVVNGFGFDICDWAMPTTFCADTFEFHHGLVETRFNKQNVYAPRYLINRKNLSEKKLTLMRPYFDDPRQKKPLLLDECRSLREEFNLAVADIRHSLVSNAA